MPLRFSPQTSTLSFALLLVASACDPSGKNVDPCELGFFRAESATACVSFTDCDRGRYVVQEGSSAHDRVCGTCPPGTYSAEPNQPACSAQPPCPAGTTQVATSSVAPRTCESCAVGTFCPGGDVERAACVAGEWDHDADSSTICLAWSTCAPGMYGASAGDTTHDRTCSACASGAFSTTSNASSCTTWTTCEAGTYVQVAGTSERDRVCAGCPTGTYTMGPDREMCLPAEACPAGTVQTQYATHTMPAVCAPCVAGQYCGGHLYPATACGPGNTWDHDADPATLCVPWTACVAGEHIVSAGDATTDRVCEECADGTFSIETNASTCRTWRICPMPYREHASGTTTTNRVCTIGVWTEQVGGPADDDLRALAVDGVGNAYVVGTTDGALPGQVAAGNLDVFVLGYGPDGSARWTRQFGTAGIDTPYDVAVDAEGDVYVVGTTAGALPGQVSAGNLDAYVRKYDGDGNIVWTLQIGTSGIDWAAGIAIRGGAVYVVGVTHGTLPGQTRIGGVDGFLLALDLAGARIWTRQLGTTSSDLLGAVTTDLDGNVYVGGDVFEATFPGETGFGLSDAFVRKYDSSGNALWTRQLGTVESDEVSALAADAAGNVFVIGHVGGAFPGYVSSGGDDVFVRKYDGAGSALWTRQFGSIMSDGAGAAAVDAAGHVHVCGYALFQQHPAYVGGSDAFVREYDDAGNEARTLLFGTTSSDSCEGIALDGAGALYVAGGTSGTMPGATRAGSDDVFVTKLFP